ncbi:ATP-dependent RNA helicase, partial [Thraustotheca clavata]
MGVRGLTGFCKAKEDTCGVADVDLSKKTLVIDMDSFLHYACEQVALQYAPFSASWTLLGGDHRALYVWVQEWMKKFFRAQIRLKFIRDPPGRLNSIKDVTSEKRSAQRAEKAAIVRNGIFTPKDSTPEVVNNVLPTKPNDIVVNEDSDAAKIAIEAQSVFPMARATLVRCIQHAGVSLVTTSMEADEALGKFVRNGKAFAVLAQDSDYLLMQDVLYIPFPKVVFGEDGSVRAYVYSANKVAETLGIPPNKLIEVALVCGNDFTPYLERHFDFAAKVNLPTLRQTQGFWGIMQGVEWLERQFGGTNWLDDPSFQMFLKGNSKALSYVYSVYSFYGAGDQLLSRYPEAERESNLAPSEWKTVIKLLDKHNFPNFALDVLYCRERHLSSRFITLWSQPLVIKSNCLLYHALGQTTEVLEYYSEATDESHSRVILPSSPDGKKPIPINRILLTSKDKRRTTFQRNVLALLQNNQQLHDSLAKWKGSKSHYELQVIGNALALTIASSDESLHQYILPLLLTSAICKAMQKQYGTVPLQAVANQPQIEISNIYRFWIDWQLNHLTIFGLAANLNPHAFFSAGIFSCVTSLVPPQVYSKQQVNRVVSRFFNDDIDMIQLSSWSYWILAPLFEPHQPPPLALQILGSASKQQIPAVVAKKMARSKKKSAKNAVAQVEKDMENLSISSDSLSATAPEITPTPVIERSEPVHIEKLIFTLPVFAHKDEIINNISENSLTIIQGETGCGKSTSVPQFILNENPDVNVFITQPRRVAAITLASTVAKMRGESVGGTIGYRVGQYQRDSKATRITYATTGYMLERVIHMPESMKTLTHIILDEAHERSMDMDLLLLMIKTHWHMWPELKLIIMYFKKGLPKALVQKKPLFVGSALFDVKAIYMDEIQKHLKDASEILTRAKKLTEQLQKWRKSDLDPEIMGKKIIPVVQIQLELCVALALHITKTSSDGSCILIFLPGISDIQYVHEQLERIQDIKLFVLHSDLDLEDQEKAFAPVEGKVKIILSTNIAESSVTIPDVTHIINSGMEKQIVMPSTGHMEVLVRSWCSKASVKQRSGRAGRIRSGIAYHLFTKAFMNECMTEYTIPELLRKPLDKVVLQLKSQLDHVGTPTEILRNAMSVPDLRNIAGAYKTLYDFSAVTETEETESNSITPFGDFCTNLPLDVRLCRMLMYSLSAYEIGMQNGLVDAIIMVCILVSPDLHVAPSHFHSTCAQKYMNEMKQTLENKLKLQKSEDGKDLW